MPRWEAGAEFGLEVGRAGLEEGDEFPDLLTGDGEGRGHQEVVRQRPVDAAPPRIDQETLDKEDALEVAWGHLGDLPDAG